MENRENFTTCAYNEHIWPILRIYETFADLSNTLAFYLKVGVEGYKWTQRCPNPTLPILKLDQPR